MSMLPTKEQTPQWMTSPPGYAPMAPAGPAPAAAGLTGRDILHILRRRMWWIIISIMITTILSVLGTAVWIYYAPRYAADAYLRIQVPKTSMINLERHFFVAEEMNRMLNDHTKNVLRRRVLEKAIELPEVAKTAWCARRAKDKIVDDLIEETKSSVVPETYMIVVRMGGVATSYAERADLANIANGIGKAYIEMREKEAKSQRQDQIALLNDELRALGTKLDVRQKEIDEIRREAAVPQMAERRGILGMRLQEEQAQMLQLAMLGEELQRGLDDLRKVKEANANLPLAKKDFNSVPELNQMIQDDGDLRSLRQQMVGYDSMVMRTALRLGSKHRQTLALIQQMNGLQQQYAQRLEETMNAAITKLQNTQETELARVRSRSIKLATVFREDQATSRDLVERLAVLDRKMAEADDMLKKLQRIDDALRELNLLDRGEEREVSWASQADVPDIRSSPRWEIMVPLGVMIGLMIGGALAFGLELLDTSIKSSSDVSRRVGLPLLGMVPHTDDLEEGAEDLTMAFAQGPDTMVAEAFRQIRTCLLFSGPPEQRRSLIVTSPMPEDGRTSVALNLGAAIARGGRKVLVIDANFRQPKIAELFPRAAGQGLSSALVGQADWRKVVHEIEPNFSVMAAGPMPPNPAELLGSEEIRRIIAEASTEFDQILFDTAPCLVVTDPSVLSTVVDGAIIVVRAGASTYGMVQRGREMLSRLGAHITGVVLNGVRATAGGYLRKSYDRFYEYSEPALPEPEKQTRDK